MKLNTEVQNQTERPTEVMANEYAWNCVHFSNAHKYKLGINSMKNVGWNSGDTIALEIHKFNEHVDKGKCPWNEFWKKKNDSVV